jgi:23S rRNA pseudouridine2605 synthase
MTDNSRNDRRPDRGRPGDERASALKAETEAPQEDRIAKVIARAGIASRRDAEAMIAEGRVTLNGAVLDSPAVNVTDRDRITVDGEPLPARERTRLWLFHKPRGLVTTARDPEGRPTVFESLPEDLPRVVAIGRLDINTEGLLLLTNDGGLAKVIAHPDTGWMRRYRVRAHGDVTQAELDKLKAGITLEGMDYGPVEATLDRVQGDNVWITLGLREGKNREVKKILEHLGLAVNRLIRLSFGPFQLGELESGLVEEVRTKVLKEQLGTKLAGEAGVDFESPVREPIAPFGSEIRKAKGERPPRRDDRRDRDDRPRGTFGERPQRNGERDFKSRDRDGGPRGGASRGGQRSDERPRVGGRPERRPTVWRDGGEDRPRHKAPRRGEDPRAARAAAGERPRERVASIKAPDGGKVLVERLVSQPRPEGERPPRHRRDAPRPAPGGDDRPRRPPPPRDLGDRPPRRDREGFGDRPPRPPREGPGERPGGGFRDGPRKGSGGFKGPGGFKGDRPGGPKREGATGRGAPGGSRPPGGKRPPGGSRPPGGNRPFGGAKGPPRRPRP